MTSERRFVVDTVMKLYEKLISVKTQEKDL